MLVDIAVPQPPPNYYLNVYTFAVITTFPMMHLGRVAHAFSAVFRGVRLLMAGSPFIRRRYVKFAFSLTGRALATLVHARRRNLPGDRQKALDIMLPLVEAEEQVASDIYCLVGRIYKDMFLESHFTDTQSRDSGTHW